MSTGARAGAELSPTATVTARIAWVDIVKGIAILAVMAHHFVEHPLHYLLRPTALGIARSAASMWQISSQSAGGSVDAALLWLFGLGYQGVHIFIVASGIGLALADGRRGATPSYFSYLRKRVVRLLPPYWLFVGLLAAIGVVTKVMQWHPVWLVGLSRRDLVVNLLLVRDFSERWVNGYPSPLWFIPTILELYLLYPIIATGMRHNAVMTLVLCLAGTAVYRAFAVYGLQGVPTGTSMLGRVTPLMFGPARLFEFALGVWFVTVVRDRAGGGAAGEAFDGAVAARAGRSSAVAGSAGAALLKPMWALGLGLALWLCGLAAASCRPGFVISDPLLGAGLLLVCYVAATAVARLAIVSHCLADLGRRSYSLFLAHLVLIPTGLVFVPGSPVVPRLLAFVLTAYLLSSVLDAALTLAQRVIKSISAHHHG